MSMIIYTPVDLPNLEVDDWDKFWEFWEQNSKHIVKVHMNVAGSLVSLGNRDMWKGLDLYKKNHFITSYLAPVVNASKDFPKLQESIDKLISLVPEITCIRLLQSQIDVGSHTDGNRDEWNLRGILHYTSPKDQWYFTKPNEMHGERHYVSFNKDTMWFSYNDKHCWHGSVFDADHKKILVQVFTKGSFSESIIKESINKYKDNVIEFQ